MVIETFTVATIIEKICGVLKVYVGIPGDMKLESNQVVANKVSGKCCKNSSIMTSLMNEKFMAGPYQGSTPIMSLMNQMMVQQALAKMRYYQNVTMITSRFQIAHLEVLKCHRNYISQFQDNMKMDRIEKFFLDAVDTFETQRDEFTTRDNRQIQSLVEQSQDGVNQGPPPFSSGTHSTKI